MKVFISYSVDDREIVQTIASSLKPHAEPVFWDQNKEPGTDCWSTIWKWIDGADCVIAVITDKAVARGESINQEIGYAKGKGKVVIPMVAEAVDKSRLGCLKGITYVHFDGCDLTVAVEEIKQKLVTMDRLKRDQQGRAILVVAAIVLLALGSGQG